MSAGRSRTRSAGRRQPASPRSNTAFRSARCEVDSQTFAWCRRAEATANWFDPSLNRFSAPFLVSWVDSAERRTVRSLPGRDGQEFGTIGAVSTWRRPMQTTIPTLLALVLLLLAPGCKRKNRVDDGPCGEDAVLLDEGTLETIVELEWDDASGVNVGPTLDYLLPEDTVGFLATVDFPGVDTGFGQVYFSGQTWIDATVTRRSGWDTEPYYHWAALGGSVVAPIDASSVPTGGCLQLQPAAFEEGAARLLLQVRTEPALQPRLDLDIVVVGDTQLFREDLEEALVVTNRLWQAGGGPGVGTVEVLTQPGTTFLPYADSPALRALVVDGARDSAVRIFFVQDYLEADGTLGEAGGIPGPLQLGVEEAGVILALDAHLNVNGAIDTQLLGEVMAHEVGHQLGLFHTTESDGTRTEPIDDTADCPGSADSNGDGSFSAEECVDWDGANFMFWTAGDLVQNAITAEQGLVLASSVRVQENP